ncbi:hypothetical protein MCQ_00921, partial [Candidatus Bartonella washoeensis Sb944nv]
MKKFYATRATSNLNYSRFLYSPSLVREVSLVAVVAFLSNFSPANAGVSGDTGNGQPNNVKTNEQVQSVGVFAPVSLDEQAMASVPVSAGVMSVDVTAGAEGLQANEMSGGAHSVEIFAPSIEQAAVLEPLHAGMTIRNGRPNSSVTADEQAQSFEVFALIGEQPASDNHSTQFLTRAMPNVLPITEEDYGESHPLSSGYNSQAIGNSAIAMGPWAQTKDIDNIAIGKMAHASGKSAIAIGSEYHKENGDDYTTAKGDYTTAVGAISKALDYGATALGHRAYAYNNRSISIGFYSRAYNYGSIALGSQAEAKVDGGVAIGKGSVASIPGNIAGYDPITGKNTTQTNVIWKSSPDFGAVSVGVITGDAKDWKTRQITGIAAGTLDTDAVNVAQLKALRAFAAQGWKLSVGGANATDVSIGGTVDLAAGSTNLKITKGEKDNNIKFDLAKDITLDRAKVGGNTLDATGLVITSGPKITTAGIDAGNKEIKNIKAGELSANSQQAVTGSQLYATNNNVTQNTNKITEANTKITKNTADITTANSNISSLDKNISTYFGGGANVLQGKGPTYKIQDQQYNDVGSAFEGVNSSFTNVNNKITEVKKNLLVKQEEETKLLSSDEVSKKGTGVITIGKETGGIEISVLNQDKFTRTISGLSGGKLTENSNEAVNGSQMYVLGNKIATYLGGGADFGYGNWSDPAFKIKTIKDDGSEGEESYMNIAAAFEGVGTSFTNIKNELKKEINNVVSDSLVKQDKETEPITIGEGTDGNEISILNQEKNSRTISGLKAGTLADTSTEAVNGAQLYTLGDKVAKTLGGGASYENGTWVTPTFTVKNFNSEGSVSETTYDDVASAFTGVGNSFEKVKDSFKNIKN